MNSRDENCAIFIKMELERKLRVLVNYTFMESMIGKSGEIHFNISAENLMFECKIETYIEKNVDTQISDIIAGVKKQLVKTIERGVENESL